MNPVFVKLNNRGHYLNLSKVNYVLDTKESIEVFFDSAESITFTQDDSMNNIRKKLAELEKMEEVYAAPIFTDNSPLPNIEE